MPVVINDLDVEVIDPPPAPAAGPQDPAEPSPDRARAPSALDMLHDAFSRADRRGRRVVE